MDKISLGERVRKKRTAAIKIFALLVLFPLILVIKPLGMDRPLLDLYLEFFGYVMLILGLAGRLWAYLHIGGRKSSVLITTGPYALCRHPLYFSSFLLMIGIGFLLENTVVVLLGFPVVLLFHSVAIRREEEKLGQLFGENYELYCRKASRFFPSLKNLEREKGRAGMYMETSRMRKHLAEAFSFLLVPPVAELLENLHRAGILPNFY